MPQRSIYKKLTNDCLEVPRDSTQTNKVHIIMWTNGHELYGWEKSGMQRERKERQGKRKKEREGRAGREGEREGERGGSGGGRSLFEVIFRYFKLHRF